MATNIKLQDFTATIHKTSQLNGMQFDTIHVETLIITDQPISPDDTWYIPNDKKIDKMFLDVFKDGLIDPVPTHCSEINNRLKDFTNAVIDAQSNNLDKTKEDMITLALLSVLSKTTLTPVEGCSNTYILSYNYKLFPTGNIFTLKVTLPFPGFTIAANQDEVQMTVVTPIGAKIIEASGIASNNSQVPSQTVDFASTRKQAVSFDYKTDPTFTIKYQY